MQSNSGGPYSQYKPYGSYDDADDSDTSSEYSSSSGSTTDESDIDEPFQNFVSLPQQQQPALPINGGLGFVPPDPAAIYRIGPSAMSTDTSRAIESSTIPTSRFDLSGVALEKEVESRYNPTQFKVESRDSTATVMFSSTDRDTTAYPQPTNLQLNLPRTYKNVVSLQITQLKLLSAFLYFRDAKYNTEFTIFEQGRTDSVTLSDNIITVKIREGSYNINSLITELHQQMNKTPMFFYFPNGYDDFARIFPTSGDLSIGFNQPGDYYYNSLTDTFIQSPSMTYIVTRYFQSQYAGLFSYTPEQTLNAYYYPVLKEVFLDPAAILDITIPTISGMTVADIYKHIVFEFEGLNDKITQQLIKVNQGYLDDYRTQNTFAHSLVNSYNWTYDTFNNRITVASTSLNTSIIRYINNITTQFTNDIITTLSGGMTLANYQAMIVQRNQDAAVLTDMYNYLQTALATNFAVNFGSYTTDQLADISHIIYIQNAQDVSGVFKQYSLDYFKQKEAGQVIIPPKDFGARPTPPTRPTWKLDTLADATVDFTNINMGIRNNPYDFTMSNQIITDTYAIDPTTYTINTGNLTQTVNIVADVQPTKYTVFQFTSPVRQTIQFETLSRPLFYRYPEYNYNFGGSIPYFYNKSLSYVDNSAADITDISLNPVPIIQDGSGHPLENILTAIQLSTTRTNTVEYYSFTAPDISNVPIDSSGALYTATLTINAVNAEFGSAVTAYIYHDRAAFMADTSVERTENALHYKYTSTATAISNTLEIPIRLHTLDQYYVIFRSVSETIPDIPYNISLQINTPQLRPQYLIKNFEGDSAQNLQFSFQNPYEYLAHYSDASRINYYIARTYDPAFIRLPLTADSSITPDNQLFSLTFPPGLQPIGYDASGVSNDPTDYIFIPGDPNGEFTPSRTVGLFYDPLTTYIYQVPQAALLAPDVQNRIQYTYKGAPEKREYKIVHYHDTHFMPSTVPLDTDLTANLLHRPALRTVYDMSAADLTATYTYTVDSNFTGKQTLQLGQGVCGISFTPTEGWWDMKGFSFKSADYTATSPNNDISYIGIYPFRAVSQKNAATVLLADSIAVLDYAGRTVYDPSTAWDKNYGTYYNFKLTNRYTYNRPDIVADGLAGFTQYPHQESIHLEEDLYTAIPFNADGTVTTFHMLAGSLIPRPDINQPVTSTNSAGASIVIPAADTSSVVWQSQYKNSLPIGTQVLNYIDTVHIFKDALAFSEYNPGKYIGDHQWYLRFVGYNGGDTNAYYYLTGHPGIPYRGDVYSIQSDRSSYYNNQFDLTAAVPAGHTAITWTANTQQGYLLTANNNRLHIHTFNPLEQFITSLSGYISFAIVDISAANISIADITRVKLTAAANGEGFMIVAPAMQGTVVAFHKDGQTVSKYFSDSSEQFIDAYVHCDESMQFHVLVSADSSYTTNTKFLYDISQTNAGSYKKTYISPLFGSGLYSLRTDSHGAAYFLSTQYTNRYTSIAGRDVVSGKPYDYVARFEVNEQSLDLTIDPVNTYWSVGTSNSIFFQKHIGSLFDDKPWIIYGNTQLGADKKRGIYSAWQIFYPVIKVTLNKRANIYNSITNRIDINQPQTQTVVPENYRTCAFFYKDLSDLLADVSGPDGWKWGQETNYTAADISFNGYEFNSYINNINVAPTDVSHSYYVAIRGYTPSESFQTLVRFRAPNRYDFGQVSLTTISNEIVDSSNNPANYNPTYTQLLASFNKYFADISQVTFGSNQIANFAGIKNTTSTFTQFYNTFISRYTSYKTKNDLIDTFNTSLSTKVSTTLNTNFGTILPQSYFKRTNIGTAIPFNLLFKSYISAQIPTDAETEWGIGWNLGFDKKDYTDNTVYHAPSFFKIIDDYIYLRINSEQGMNTLDTTGKENYKETRETRGAVQQYNAKLLLANFGSYSQTLIQNPVYFNPPIGKLDRIRFTWIDSKGQIIDNTDCEWSAAINITERVDRATVDSLITRGKI